MLSVNDGADMFCMTRTSLLMRGMPAMSVEPVAGNGKINRTGWSGYAAYEPAIWASNSHAASRRIIPRAPGRLQ